MKNHSVQHSSVQAFNVHDLMRINYDTFSVKFSLFTFPFLNLSFTIQVFRKSSVSSVFICSNLLHFIQYSEMAKWKLSLFFILNRSNHQLDQWNKIIYGQHKIIIKRWKIRIGIAFYLLIHNIKWNGEIVFSSNWLTDIIKMALQITETL